MWNRVFQRPKTGIVAKTAQRSPYRRSVPAQSLAATTCPPAGVRHDAAVSLLPGRCRPLGTVDSAGSSASVGHAIVEIAGRNTSHGQADAKPWDCGPGGYQVGAFPPGCAEWNDKFRDMVRDFWRSAGERHCSAPMRLGRPVQSP